MERTGRLSGRGVKGVLLEGTLKRLSETLALGTCLQLVQTLQLENRQELS